MSAAKKSCWPNLRLGLERFSQQLCTHLATKKRSVSPSIARRWRGSTVRACGSACIRGNHYGLVWPPRTNSTVGHAPAARSRSAAYSSVHVGISTVDNLAISSHKDVLIFLHFTSTQSQIMDYQWSG